MPSVLITGANGFLGRYVAELYHGRKWRVVGLGRTPPRPGLLPYLNHYVTRSLPDASVGEILGQLRPQVLVHAAGQASVPKSMDDPTGDFAEGPNVVVALLDALRRYSPTTRFIFLSSAAVYGEPTSLPVREDHPVRAMSPYGAHKFVSETLLEHYSRMFGLKTASLRIFSAYGPGLRRQVVWDVCNKLATRGAVVLQGNGGESRDFIHGADVALAVAAAADHGALVGEPYNTASGAETRIADLATTLGRIVQPGCRVEYDGVAPAGMPRNWRADIDRLRALGFEPTVGLEEGLADFVAWFNEETRPEWQRTSA